MVQVVQVFESECFFFVCRNNYVFFYLMFKILYYYNVCEIEIIFRLKIFIIMSNVLYLNINVKYIYKCICFI